MRRLSLSHLGPRRQAFKNLWIIEDSALLVPLLCHFVYVTSGSGLAVQSTLGKINRLATSRASVGLIEFIRKNFFLLAACGACANKRLQMFVAFKSRAMLRSCHDILL
jgi:hypothetical protein